MSNDLDTYRDALATALSSITGLRCTEAGFWSSTINPPQAWFDFETRYDLTFAEGAHGFTFLVRILAKRVSERAAQKFLDDLRDPRSPISLRQVIPEHPAVVAACQYTRVMQSSQLQVVTVDEVPYLQIEWELEVLI